MSSLRWATFYTAMFSMTWLVIGTVIGVQPGWPALVSGVFVAYLSGHRQGERSAARSALDMLQRRGLLA